MLHRVARISVFTTMFFRRSVELSLVYAIVFDEAVLIKWQ